MEFVWVLIGLVGGGGGVWYYLTKLKSHPATPPTPAPDDTECQKKLAQGIEIVESIYFQAFGPVGTPPEMLVDSFNKLWIWVGKEQKGKP